MALRWLQPCLIALFVLPVMLFITADVAASAHTHDHDGCSGHAEHAPPTPHHTPAGHHTCFDPLACYEDCAPLVGTDTLHAAHCCHCDSCSHPKAPTAALCPEMSPRQPKAIPTVSWPLMLPPANLQTRGLRFSGLPPDIGSGSSHLQLRTVVLLT